MAAKIALLVCAICATVFVTPMVADAQGGDEQAVSLGDFARKQRSKQNQNPKEPAKVITNDDLPPRGPDEGVSPTTPEDSAAAAGGANESPSSRPAASDSGAQGEDYFRSEMKRLRDKLSESQAFLARFQAEVVAHNKDVPRGSGAVVVYQENPRWTTNPFGAAHDWQVEGEKLRTRIEYWEKRVAKDKKAVSDLVDQCRHQGCMPEWVR